MKTLLASPFVGEFGHLLFSWQGYVRKLSRQYDHTVVAGYSEHEYIYSDFCNEYLPFNPKGTETDGHRLRDLQENFTGFEGREGDIIKAVGHFERQDHEFIKFGEPTKNCDYDIVVHARSTNKVLTGYRNWSRENWIELFKRFPDRNIAVIGRSNAAHFFFDEESKPGSNVENFPDIRLERLANILSSSKVCVGSSSGPMHFASLCGCPHVVWSPKKHETVTLMDNRERYETIWNPLQTKVFFIDDSGWNPTVDRVEKEIRKVLEC